MTLIPELEKELVRAIARTDAVVRRNRTLRLVIALAVALVAITAAALAATGVIRIGSPVSVPGPPRQAGVGQGAVRPGNAELLPLRTSDPAGGPPWGLRVVRTTRGLGCLEVGRVVGGRLGVLGRDGSFGNDGKFHVTPATLTLAGECGLLDAHGRLFLSVSVKHAPASGSLEGKSCVGSAQKPASAGSGACRDSDGRSLYYGLLGPQAKSVTFTSGGIRKTVPVMRPNGAYLIVVPATVAEPEIASGRYPTAGPITKIDFRNGLSCAIQISGPKGGVSACPIPGYRPATPPSAGTKNLSSPVFARATRHDGITDITVEFRAPIAVTDASTDYSVTLHSPRGTARRSRRTMVVARHQNFGAGDLVRAVFKGLRGHGVYRGDVRYTTTRSTRVVGRFTVQVP